MSVEPPSSGRPTGPPSGPLSGPSRPPAGPPPEPPGGDAGRGGDHGGGRGDSNGGGPGGGHGGAPGGGHGGAPGGGRGGEPHRAWWRSAPRIAMLTTAVVVVAALAVVLTRTGEGSGKAGEVFLQAANSSGQDPFTRSTATKTVATSTAPAASAAATAPANEVRGVDGGAPGLYSGTKNSSSCDVEQQIRYFQASPPRNKAFAAQVGVQPSGVPAYLRSLTPVQLRADTRVTGHGYRDGAATTYQAVLQAGTAVLVDGHGVPRVRCACGNPLTPPVAQRTAPRTMGAAWPAYRPGNVVAVAPAAQVVNVFVLFDHEHHEWFDRHRGDHTGQHDRPAKPPSHPNPMNPPASPGPSTPASPGGGSKSPASNQPSSNAPSSKPSGSKPPSSSHSGTSQSPKTESPKSESPSSKSQEPRSPNSGPPSPQSPKSEAPASEPPASAQPASPPSPGPESAVSPAAPAS
ncbi:DUF6777 domain-containing protein [Streptomyces sp. NPDC007162]|uniref:DUF6777 domain-containing protein n=1 Tax=Streptomyces sp. NPDC007162 TaxID=3156917 RepID=UPI0034103C91